MNVQDPSRLVGQVAQQRGWAWNTGNGELLVEIPLLTRRTQVVHVLQGADPDGLPMLYLWSAVGPAHLAQANPHALLNHNTELSYGACALFQGQLVVKDSQLLQAADADALGRMIFHVARAADALEMQFQGAHVDRA